MTEKLCIEIFIQTKYNPVGNSSPKDIPEHLHATTLTELQDKFLGSSSYPLTFKGYWKDPDSGKVYHEQTLKLQIIAENNEDTKEFIKKYRKKLEKRYKQEKVLILYWCVQEL